MSKRKGKRNPYVFDPATMKARFSPPRAPHLLDMVYTICKPTDAEWREWLAAAEQRRKDDETAFLHAVGTDNQQEDK